MPGVLWKLWFLGGQGFKVNNNILYRDKQSAILMESNWKYLCGKKTRNIDMRYLFITKRIKQKEVRVKYYTMKEMTGDYFTKPIQGALLRRHMATIINLEDWSKYTYA